MEMEMEASASTSALDRIEQAAAALEQVAETCIARLAGVELQAAATRESDLAQRLEAAESTIATLRASRKTTAAGALLAKEGVALEAGALDIALSTLSLEQRIAVKAQLLRSGLLG